MSKESKKRTQDLLSKVNDFKDKFKTDGEYLVKEVFPAKILELEDIFQAFQQFDQEYFCLKIQREVCQTDLKGHFGSLKLSNVPEIYSDLNIPVPDPKLFYNDVEEPHLKKRKLDVDRNNVDGISGSPVMILPNGLSPCNKKLSSIAETVKPMIRELIDHANTLKMWISLQIPKIEDGNNFGVSVQEESLGEARQVESEAASYLDQISRYFITRAKIVSKVAKYPHIEDYRQSVKELDEKQYISLRLVVCELRNHYASLHDVVMKNLEKIKKPRSANTESLY